MLREHVVVMLTANQKAPIVLSSTDKKLKLDGKDSYFSGHYQHLYILSNDKIEEGNWFLSDDRNHISELPRYRLEQCIAIENDWIFGSIDKMDQGHNPSWSKKIIATTNKELWNLKTPYKGANNPSVAKIPLSFVEAYVKEQGINKVNLEYNDPVCKCNTGLKFKVRSDNSVIIHSVKQKTYTKEEHITNLIKYRVDYEQFKKDSHYSPNGKEIELWSNNWIEQNL